MAIEDHLTLQLRLEQAIAAQERLRGTIDDAVIDTTIVVLRKELAEIRSTSADPQQQRKMVTVLFMDVVNSTRLIQYMDPEVSMEILDTSLQSLADPVQRFGGHVTRFMGDGFLAVFGLPTAQENDPEMAVRAGLAILTTAENIAQSLKNERGIERFQVRVGINTGLVVAGGVTEEDDTLMGSAVHLAARLEQAAEPGTILISSHTFQHIRGLFELEQSASIKAKGFPEPIETYRILGTKSRAFRLMNRGVEGVETHMVGREQEMLRVQMISQKVFYNHEFQLAIITGEAGLGKSRFLDEFETWLDLQPIAVQLFKGRATLETQNHPYALLRDIFTHQFKILDDDPIQVLRNKFIQGFKQILQEDAYPEMQAQFVGQLLGYDFRDSESLKSVSDNPQLMRDRALFYLRNYFQAVAAQLPVAIFLDDLHWADDSSLDFISQLCPALSDQPVLLIALSRPVLFESKPDWGQENKAEIIPLAPLSRAQSGDLVSEVLQKVKDLPATLCDTIVERAEGNPYYLEEIVRMLVEEGIILKEDPVWRVQADRLDAARIPSTLAGIIQARLDGLPHQERTILQQASVIGRIFWDSAIRYFHRENSLEIIDNISVSLDSLQNREMVFRRSPSAFSDAAEYLFKHAFIRDVTYETVLLRQRKIYHNLVANWLIDQRGDRAAEMSALIANHLVKAGKIAEASGYFQQAAEIAASKYANQEAAELYQQAIDLNPEQDQQRCFSLLLDLETILNLLGDRQAQVEVLENLALTADQLKDDRKKIDVLLRKAWFHFWKSEFPEMLNLGEQIVALSQTIGDAGQLQNGYYIMAWAQLRVGNTIQAIQNANLALGIALEMEDRLGEGNTLNMLGLIAITQGDYVEARNYIQKFLQIAQELGNINRQLPALNNLVVALNSLGDFQTAMNYALQLLDIALEIGDRVTEGTACVNLAWIAASQEDWDSARDYALKGVAIKREELQIEALAESLVWLGYTRLGLGQSVEAEQDFRESEKIRHKLGHESLRMESISGLSRALLAQGNAPEAVTLTEEVLGYISTDENLSGAWEPLRIYWNCYQVLKAAKDARAVDLLQSSIDLLQKRAAKIPDENERERFLTNIPWNRKIWTEYDSVQR